MLTIATRAQDLASERAHECLWSSMPADVLVRAASDTLSASMADAAHLIERELAGLLGEASGPEARLIEAMRYASLNGGKRMRGFLVLQVSRLFGVADRHSVRVAASVEMLHAYSLVHDDLPCMDDDDLRRGRPSTHRAFDEATAVLTGDALQTRAFEVLADPATHPNPEARCQLVAELGAASGARGMAGGQMIDMVTEGCSLQMHEVARLQALKTGCLIQYSAEAGAILAQVPPADRARIRAYGRDLGAAFQMADDLLDALGDTAAIGKTAGKDAAAGKATIVALLGVERAAVEARALSDRAIGHLADFGAKAQLLRDLATYVVGREH